MPPKTKGERMRQTKYKIIVRTIQGNILTYNVDDYKEEGNFVVFIDKVTRKRKRFNSLNVEIEEWPNGD
jgi:hypothetical protein